MNFGKIILTYEEYSPTLCNVQAIINSLQLIFMSEYSLDFISLTPAMLLTQNISYDVTDIDVSDFSKFQKRVRYRKKHFEDLRSRFRKQYLIKK